MSTIEKALAKNKAGQSSNNANSEQVSDEPQIAADSAASTQENNDATVASSDSTAAPSDGQGMPHINLDMNYLSEKAW